MGDLTQVQEARFEVGLGLLMDITRDLVEMRDQWTRGEAAYRVTEEAMEEDPR